MKSLTGHGLVFLDTALVLQGSLKSLSETMFKDDASKRKYECELMLNVTPSVLLNMRVQDANQIIVYCE